MIRNNNNFNKLINEINKHGGILLSKYLGYKKIISVQCEKNHIFTIAPFSLLSGNWCDICNPRNNKKNDINKINIIFLNKNIKCISEKYIDNKNKLKWQCLICYFIFEKNYNDMQRSFIGCSNCRGFIKNNSKGMFSINPDVALQNAKNIIKKYNGILLSTEYNGSNENLECKCYFGHIFSIKYANLVNIGRWCKICSDSINISEEICRAHFEQIFDKKFIKIRPKWLESPISGYKLELDGYCEDLLLAFEHQGAQHYEKCFNMTDEDLKKRQEYDELKLKICNENNVKLIQIPILFKKTTVNNLKYFIKKECEKLNIIISKNINELNINLTNIYFGTKFNEYKKIAEEKGGCCISTEYFGAINEKLVWKCKNGHQWKQFPYLIKKGSWCTECPND
jgi:hypothetical protein